MSVADRLDDQAAVHGFLYGVQETMLEPEAELTVAVMTTRRTTGKLKAGEV